MLINVNKLLSCFHLIFISTPRQNMKTT